MLITTVSVLSDYFNFFFILLFDFTTLFFFFPGNTKKKAHPAAPLPGGIRYKIQNNLSVTTGNKNDILEGQSQPPPRSHRQRFHLLLSQGAEMPAKKRAGENMGLGEYLRFLVIFLAGECKTICSGYF